MGLVSEDFRVHPVAVFLLPLLQRRDRARFEVYCYSLTERPDHVTRRMEALADRWVGAAAWTDDEVAQAIARDGVDILIDFGGHTGRARLGIFAVKPARLQVSWVGYLNTTGLTRIDYRLTESGATRPRCPSRCTPSSSCFCRKADGATGRSSKWRLRLRPVRARTASSPSDPSTA